MCVQQLWSLLRPLTLHSDGPLHLHHLFVVSKNIPAAHTHAQQWVMLKNEVILKAGTKKGHTVHGRENIMSYTLLQLSKWALRHIKHSEINQNRKRFPQWPRAHGNSQLKYYSRSPGHCFLSWVTSGQIRSRATQQSSSPWTSAVRLRQHLLLELRVASAVWITALRLPVRQILCAVNKQT